ncbi:MAG TPA: hypothetical protein VEW74_08045 [Candidatus Nitrosotalea sp.]|nr:hypothetical protein [Candidatus Nitrosotalea sp.]
MTALRDRFPLKDHQASLQQYLGRIVFPAGSVAGHIVEERLPSHDARDSVRPSLILWACDAGKGDRRDALPVAAAFDLFEHFLSLHEELTNHSATVERWGLGQSLNAGDALYALAFRSLAGDVENPRRRLQAARLVGQAVLEAIETRDEIERGASLTSAALQAGALIAGISEPALLAFADAGRLLNADPAAAVAALRPVVSSADLAVFEDVARYVAAR